MRTWGIVIAGIALLSANCSRPPPPAAVQVLTKSLQAAVAGDSKQFIATLLPAARSNAPSMRELPYFLSITSFKVRPKNARQITGASIRLPADLHFGKEPGGTVTTIDFAMVRFEGKWCIDIYDTIQSERDKRGAEAFRLPRSVN